MGGVFIGIGVAVAIIIAIIYICLTRKTGEYTTLDSVGIATSILLGILYVPMSSAGIEVSVFTAVIPGITKIHLDYL